jgi:hypothetical protein
MARIIHAVLIDDEHSNKTSEPGSQRLRGDPSERAGGSSRSRTIHVALSASYALLEQLRTQFSLDSN